MVPVTVLFSGDGGGIWYEKSRDSVPNRCDGTFHPPGTERLLVPGSSHGHGRLVVLDAGVHSSRDLHIRVSRVVIHRSRMRFPAKLGSMATTECAKEELIRFDTSTMG